MKKKLKITISQLKAILTTQKPKFPLLIIMDGITKEELGELAKILKAKKKN